MLYRAGVLSKERITGGEKGDGREDPVIYLKCRGRIRGNQEKQEKCCGNTRGEGKGQRRLK